MCWRAMRKGSLLRSFAVAFSGIGGAIMSERNLRIHLSTALLVLLIAPFYRLSRGELLTLLLLFSMVIAAELLNTAIEVVVDLASPDYHLLAKRAKDIAAGGVLVTAITAVTVGLILFCAPAGIARLLGAFRQRPVVMTLAAAGYLIFALSFIFCLPNSRKEPNGDQNTICSDCGLPQRGEVLPNEPNAGGKGGHCHPPASNHPHPNHRDSHRG